MSKKLYAFLLIFVVILSCKPEEEKDTFWDSIQLNDNYTPFVFIFSNTEIITCAEHAQPKLEDIWAGKNTNVPASSINSVMMFPSVLDNHYSFIAEELKFLFDANGNNTLETWPAYFNNLTCYNIDSTAWFNSINSDFSKTPKIKMGLRHAVEGGELKVYLKGNYTTSTTKNSVAIYVYRKEELAYQKTDAGTELTTIKNKIIGSMTPTFGEIIDDGETNKELRETYTFSLGSEIVSNLGFVAVIYQLEGSKPTSVINSLKMESL